ncbi:MAG: glycosyltransferase [Nitrososphaerota archaeon]
MIRKLKNLVSSPNGLPLISIIITCKNSLHTITETLESLKNQTFKNFEVIIVDGFSSDGTYEYLIKESKRWPVLKVFQKNGNPATGRNLAIKMSNGEYLAFIDADAYADKKWLEILLSNIVEREREGFVCIGGPGLIPEKSSLIEKAIGFTISHPLINGWTRNNLIWNKIREVEHNPFFNVICPKWIFERVGLLDERLDIGEDVEFGCRLRKYGYKVLYIPNAIVYHHRKSNLGKLMRQMFNYGFWRSVLRSISFSSNKLYNLLLYYLVPTAPLLLISTSLYIVIFKNLLLIRILALIFTAYLTIISYVALKVALKLRSMKAFFISLVGSLVTHSGYILGLLAGLVLGSNKLKLNLRNKNGGHSEFISKVFKSTMSRFFYGISSALRRG